MKRIENEQLFRNRFYKEIKRVIVHCFKIRTSTGKDLEWAIIYAHVSFLIPGYSRRQLGGEGTVPEEADETESNSNRFRCSLQTAPPPLHLHI